MTIFLFGFMILLFLLNMPIAFAVGIAATATIYFFTDVPLNIVVQTVFSGTDSFPLMAIPFFVLAGAIMEKGMISKRLVDFASALVGHIRGGLAMVSVVAAMFFAGISGSAAADSAAVGSVLIPSMIAKKYPRTMSTAIQSAAGSIGVIIPPSIPMVVYALTANVSIGGLFLGGYIPGILMGLGLMFACYLLALKHGFPSEGRFSLKRVFTTFKSAFLSLFSAVIIVGGVLSGVFTATESACVAVLYAVFLSVFVYKTLKWRDFPGILVNAGLVSAIVMITVATASALSWVLASEQIPSLIANFIVNTIHSKFLILLAINIMLLIVGAFLDCSPAIIIFVPILAPIAQMLQIHPLHFGVMVVTNLAIGLSSPPVGICTFVSCSIGQVSISQVAKDLAYFLSVMVIILLLITYIPQLVTFLPTSFGFN